MGNLLGGTCRTSHGIPGCEGIFGTWDSGHVLGRICTCRDVKGHLGPGTLDKSLEGHVGHPGISRCDTLPFVCIGQLGTVRGSPRHLWKIKTIPFIIQTCPKVLIYQLREIDLLFKPGNI